MSSTGPAPKKQKTYNADGPVEDDKTAREKLREAGFDPDDVHTARSDVRKTRGGSWWNITPMTYFASVGDLPMCRYLHHVRGASTRAAADEHKTDPDERIFWYPMYAAVQYAYPEIVKWLFRHGAKEDARITSYGEPSPLGICFSSLAQRLIIMSRASKKEEGIKEDEDEKVQADLAKWFVLNGAMEIGSDQTDKNRVVFCLASVFHQYAMNAMDESDNEFICILTMLRGFSSTKSWLLSWADDQLSPNGSFQVFLLGTLQPLEYSVDSLKKLCARRLGSIEVATIFVEDAVRNGKSRDIWDKLNTETNRPPSANACLASHSGILERIGEYVGVVKSKTKVRRLKEFHSILSALPMNDLPDWCLLYNVHDRYDDEESDGHYYI